MFHSLVQHLNRSAHGANNSASNNSLRQFQMMQAEQMDTFIEVHQPFGNVVKPKELLVAPVDIVDADILRMQLLVESLTQPGTNVEKSKETGRIQAAAMPEAGANDVVVIRRDGLQHVQHGDGELKHLVGATHKARSIAKVSLRNMVVSALKLES